MVDIIISEQHDLIMSFRLFSFPNC